MQSTTSSTRTFISPSAKTDKDAAKTTHRPLISRRNLPWLAVAVLAIFCLFLFAEYRSAQHKLQAATGNIQQVKDLITQVRKLVVLPANETPTVATVAHADKLKSLAFFANAQDGDKVLVYNNEKEAILYRPSTNQIVIIAPVSATQAGVTNPTP